MAIAPVRYPSGVQNVQYPGTGGNATFTGASNYHPLFKYPALDPFRLVTMEDDFTSGFNATSTTGKWLTTSASSGGAAVSTTIPGGVVTLTTAASSADTEEIQMVSPALTTTTTNQFWFSTLIQASDVTNSVLVVGVQNINTTPESPTEGFYFIKPTGAANVNFTTKSTAGGTVTATSIVDMVNATNMILSFYYDGSIASAEDDNSATVVKYYVNKVYAGYVTITGIPVAQMAPVAYIKTSATAAKSLSVDYIMANCEMTR